MSVELWWNETFFSRQGRGKPSADCFKVWFDRCLQEGEIKDNGRRMINA